MSPNVPIPLWQEAGPVRGPAFSVDSFAQNDKRRLRGTAGTQQPALTKGHNTNICSQEEYTMHPLYRPTLFEIDAIVQRGSRKQPKLARPLARAGVILSRGDLHYASTSPRTPVRTPIAA